MKTALLAVTSLFLCAACCQSPDHQPVSQHADAQPEGKPVSVVDPELTEWKEVKFGGEGRITYEDGVLNLDMGSPMTGLVYTGDPEKVFGESLENYTITLKAKRVEGIDIFLGLTFPVGTDGHVSLVLGGWAGAISGISNLDGANASENATTKYHAFEDNTWYDVKIRVTDKIECWLDGKKIVDEPRADYTRFTTHGSVVDTVPFGLFTYSTWGAYKDLKVWKKDR